MIGRLRLEIKSQRGLYWVPVVIILLVVPLVDYSLYLGVNRDMELTRIHILRAAQQFVPVCAVWWPSFVMREYINAPGNELLFVYRFGKDTILNRMLVLWGWHGLHWCLPAAFYFALFPQMAALFVLVLSQSFFLIALCYALSMLLRNTLIPLMGLVVYTLLCVIFNFPFSIFSMASPLTEPAEALPAALMLLVGGVLLAVGYSLERRLLKDGC